MRIATSSSPDVRELLRILDAPKNCKYAAITITPEAEVMVKFTCYMTEEQARTIGALVCGQQLNKPRTYSMECGPYDGFTYTEEYNLYKE